MSSIIGDKGYRNASGLDASIADVTAKLAEATKFYNEAMTGIALCNNSSLGCVSKSGRHISTWRDWRDRYGPLVTQYKKELTELLALKTQMAAATTQTAVSTADTAQSSIVVAKANEAIAEAETTQVVESTKKVGLYIGLGLGVIALIIGSIYVFKKMKK